MRYELADYEWAAIKSLLPNKPHGVLRVNDRLVLNGIFWVLRSGAPWRDLPDAFGPYVAQGEGGDTSSKVSPVSARIAAAPVSAS